MASISNILPTGKQTIIGLVVTGILSALGFVGTLYLDTVMEAEHTTGFNECEKKHLLTERDRTIEVVALRFENVALKRRLQSKPESAETKKKKR